MPRTGRDRSVDRAAGELFVEGVVTPRAGARLSVGDAILEVTMETKPCQMMDRARKVCARALQPDWRGGVCCNVVAGGAIRIGDAVSITDGRG